MQLCTFRITNDSAVAFYRIEAVVVSLILVDLLVSIVIWAQEENK